MKKICWLMARQRALNSDKLRLMIVLRGNVLVIREFKIYLKKIMLLLSVKLLGDSELLSIHTLLEQSWSLLVSARTC